MQHFWFIRGFARQPPVIRHCPRAAGIVVAAAPLCGKQGILVVVEEEMKCLLWCVEKDGGKDEEEDVGLRREMGDDIKNG